MLYTYDVEHRALPDSQYRVFSELDAVTFAFDVADAHSIPLQRVEWAPGQLHAEGGDGVIRLPTDEFGRNIITILHEIAHVAAPGGEHGTEWFRWFVYLLRKEVSITAAAALEWEISQTV